MARKKKTRKIKNTRKNREKIARVIIESMKVFKEDDKRLRVTEFDDASKRERQSLMDNSWVATGYRIDDVFAKDAETNPADSLDDFVRTLFKIAGNRALASALGQMI